MHIVQEVGQATYVIRGYAPGEIRINEVRYTQSLIITPNQLDLTWQPKDHTRLELTDLMPVLPFEPEVILLGSGQRLRFPDQEIVRFFYARHIGLEVMDTAAACRTYNILMVEGRTVAGMLIVE